MKNVMILAALSLVLLLGACGKDVVDTTTINTPLETTDEVSLRQGYKSMLQLKDQLKKVITDKGLTISAAWVQGENIGFITGTKFAVVNRVTGEMINDFLLNASNQNFWFNAPRLKTKYSGSDGPDYGPHYPLNNNNGITAGWTYENSIGFTSKNVYWHTPISEFGKTDVWRLGGHSKSGYLNEVPFWSNISNQTNFKGITAGFSAPNNMFVAFSGSKIFVKKDDKWILNKEITDLEPHDPLYFLKHAPLPQLEQINGAFYNEGVNEYVFMSEMAWAAYNDNPGNKSWSYGSLSPCFDESKVDTNIDCGNISKEVCGCNGITYINGCTATTSGIASYTFGKCY